MRHIALNAVLSTYARMLAEAAYIKPPGPQFRTDGSSASLFTFSYSSEELFKYTLICRFAGRRVCRTLALVLQQRFAQEGPGAYSIDARRFGFRGIIIPPNRDF
jgi:hypothetical protein